MQKLDKDTRLVLISLITLIGILLLSYNFVEAKKIATYDYMSEVLYKDFKPKKIKVEKEKKEEIKKEVKKEELPQKEEIIEETVTNEYIGYLNIPKINLNKGFLNIKAQDNDVEKNIQVIEGSDYPDKEKGNLIIAGHSGTGWKAFFNDLYKLQVGDTQVVSYKGKKYIYQIVNIYNQPKTGQVAIYRNYDKTTLTLITCTNTSSVDQTIYISELQSIE